MSYDYTRSVSKDPLHVYLTLPFVFIQIGVQSLQSLNHFQRYAYVRLAHARETRVAKEQNYLFPPPSGMASRTPSNRSESSLGL